MLCIIKQSRWFKRQNIWFAPRAFDVPGVDVVHFYACRAPVPGFSCSKAHTLVLDLNQDLEKIWQNMGKKSCRYYINRSHRLGIDIQRNRHHDAYHRMYLDFIADKGIDTTPESVAFMKKHATLYTAWQAGRLLSGVLTLSDDNTTRWLFGGSIRMSLKDPADKLSVSCATRRLVWEAICQAKQEGKKEFDLGGFHGGTDKRHPLFGIDRFKEKFGGEQQTYFTCRKYYSPIYAGLAGLKKLTKYKSLF